MAPGQPTLALFPPPERNWPQRTTSRKQPKLTIPQPIAERMEKAKSPVDFHELVIRVDSAPTTPAEGKSTSPIQMPQRAHMGNPKTPPQQTASTFDSPPRARTALSSVHFDQESIAHSLQRSESRARPERPRVASPSQSIKSARSGNGTSPVSPSSPSRRRAATPAQSDVMSARSGSPTLVRPNSAISRYPQDIKVPPPPPGGPVMRSMFPQYNPDLPLNAQAYHPTTTSPTHLPGNVKISRPLYSPQGYVPHRDMAEDEDIIVAPAVTPYYTPSTALDSLWDATNGQGTPVVQVFTLQMHRKSAATGTNESQIVFGPSGSLPFYSLKHSDIPQTVHNPVLDEVEDHDNADHELLITRHHPNKPTSLPISHFALTPTPVTNNMAASAFSTPAPQEQNTSLITTIYPKLAALAALETAAHSPAASHIATFDPDATSPAAQRLAEDVLRGTAERECCALVWTRASTGPQTTLGSTAAGTYALHHPTLGMFPITHEGDMSPGLSPILGAAPFASSKRALRSNNRPTAVTLVNPFVGTAADGRPASSSDDSVLARLDFGNDSLVINVAAMLRLGNAYLIDVAVSTLLAVALAEEKRVRREMRFEAPPTMPAFPSRSATAESLDEGKKEKKAMWYRIGQRGARRLEERMRNSGPRVDSAIDLEMQTWGAPPKKAGKGSAARVGGAQAESEESKLPFVARTIIHVLKFTIKTVIWVLSITFKILSGVVVTVSHWVQTKA